MSYRCWFGFHDWKTFGSRLRYCRRCHKEQRLWFYSNYTQEWK
jgi:hypothetical protein